MINSCIEGINQYGTIVYYSHLIPVFISIILIFFVLVKARGSLVSKAFAAFIITFCIWLVGDVFAWTSSNYDIISAFWSVLDYVNIVFYLLALYFFLVFTKGSDIEPWKKFFLIGMSLPAWLVTITGNSILYFDTTLCEAGNSEFLTQYKLVVEVVVILIILAITVHRYAKLTWEKFKSTLFVSVALILFFAAFSVTEFISSNTGVYEINLYSLFILPVFLFVIIYSVTNLQILSIKFNGTQILTYVMMVLVGSQFFFLENTTNQVLTVITFILALSFGILLTRDAKKEIRQREQIEKLAVELKSANTRLIELDKQKSEFVSFATHQLKSPLAAMKGYASLILDGDYGDVNPQVHESVNRIYESSRTLANVVEEYLNISRIELGSMKYYLEDQDVKPIIDDVIGELKPNIEKTGISFTFDAKPDNYVANVDVDKIKQVFMNFIDNSVKYTPTGKIEVVLERKGDKILFKVSDTGIGMSEKTIQSLFLKFTRAYNANKTNIHGTGLGLYVAKQIVDAHGGKVWAESKGEGKGSVFYVELAGK